jgi:transketolase
VIELQASTRAAVTEGLMELAAADPRVVLVCMDTLTTMKAEPFREAHPDRLFDVGIAEQHAVAFASGLALCGMRPWVAAFAGFITMRACEEVRTFVAYPNLNVKLVGANSGLAGGGRDGATHQFIEDLGIMRTMPGMTIVVPADADQTRQAVLALSEIPGPAYIRIGSGRDPVVFSHGERFELGKIRLLERHGDDVALFADGYLLPRALEAGRALATIGVMATVVEVHTLKPLDVDGITGVLRLTRAAVTVEDHNIIGGLGSAIAEVIAEHAPARLARIGVRDVFGESGVAGPLLDKYQMGIKDIVEAARMVVENKKG